MKSLPITFIEIDQFPQLSNSENLVFLIHELLTKTVNKDGLITKDIESNQIFVGINEADVKNRILYQQISLSADAFEMWLTAENNPYNIDAYSSEKSLWHFPFGFEYFLSDKLETLSQPQKTAYETVSQKLIEIVRSKSVNKEQALKIINSLDFTILSSDFNTPIGVENLGTNDEKYISIELGKTNELDANFALYLIKNTPFITRNFISV